MKGSSATLLMLVLGGLAGLWACNENAQSPEEKQPAATARRLESVTLAIDGIA